MLEKYNDLGKPINFAMYNFYSKIDKIKQKVDENNIPVDTRNITTSFDAVKYYLDLDVLLHLSPTTFKFIFNLVHNLDECEDNINIDIKQLAKEYNVTVNTIYFYIRELLDNTVIYKNPKNKYNYNYSIDFNVILKGDYKKLFKDYGINLYYEDELDDLELETINI